MMWLTWTRWMGPQGVNAVALALLLMLATVGCGALDVSDPTAIEDDELNNAAGAALLRGDALRQFSHALGIQALQSGLLTDEFRYITHGLRLPVVDGPDRRDVPLERSRGYYLSWLQVRRAATVALVKLRSYGPPTHAGEMLALRGAAMRRLAENFCPGFPGTELIDLQVIPGPPLTTDQALERALTDFDSALTLAADSARVLNLARVGRGAALLGLGRFAEAAAAVADVPTDYTWHARYVGVGNGGNNGTWNPLLFNQTSDDYVTLADQEGGNGLAFLSAGDPRVEPRLLGTTDDGVTPWHNSAKYADDGAPIVVASGIEARLIEAEAALATGGDWLGILNTLRATQVSPALPDTTDPGTDAARLDLLFRERAFWLYATGHRLGDLRRLVRLYGRDPESVFPTGPYHEGGVYGTATSLPFNPADEAPFNPAVTGCTGP